MRRTLPLVAFCAIAAGCGRHYTPPPKPPPPAKPKPPMVVAKLWLKDVNTRDVGAGGRLFAKGAHVPEGTLANERRADVWVERVACSGRLVRASETGMVVTLTLVSTKGPNTFCAKPGRRFRVAITVRHGRIVNLRYL